jgi:protein transport protein SEC24
MQASTLAAVRSSLIDKCVDVLAAYRKHCASTTSPGQLILPESLKLLPIYVLALTKHALFKGYVDVQAAYMYAFYDMSPSLTTPLVYPRLYPLHKLPSDTGNDDTGRYTVLPTPQRLISEYLEAEGAYLVENGSDIYLWLGRNASPTTSEMFTEVAAAANQRAGAPTAPHTHADTDRVLRFVQAIRKQRCKSAVVHVVRSRDQQEGKLIAWLVEDRAGETPSYVDFLVQVHKMIQGRLA